MRKLIRSPLTWMVVAEILVVTALVVLAWSALASAAGPAVAAPVISSPASSSDEASPLPDLPQITKPASSAPVPGLSVDPVFWLGRLQALNRDQLYFEQLEWRLVHGASDAAQRYLETVVLPSLRQAERPVG
jgi:hypothetical protein